MRKLATVQRIAALLPIPGADQIEVAQVLGWNVVVRKGDFQVGDLCVYFEIDSFLPASHDAFNSDGFKARHITWNGKVGMRLKTIRLRKQLSQGLVLPLDEFPELTMSVRGFDRPYEGEDLTALLNIEKWEPAEETRANNGGAAAQRSREKPWPFFLQKTDQERVQNCVAQLQRAAENGESFEVTIKLDGSSMTVYTLTRESPHFEEFFAKRAFKYESDYLKSLSLWETFKYWFGRAIGKRKAAAPNEIQGVCSRNLEKDINDGSNFSDYVNKHDLFAKIRNVHGSYAFQGELVAPDIQGNYEKVKEPEFYVYDVFDIDKQEYVKPTEARLLTEFAGLNYVPVVSKEFNLHQEGEELIGRVIVDKVLAMAEGPGMNEGVKREGLVFKSNETPFSFKAISNSYLERKG